MLPTYSQFRRLNCEFQGVVRIRVPAELARHAAHAPSELEWTRIRFPLLKVIDAGRGKRLCERILDATVSCTALRTRDALNAPVRLRHGAIHSRRL